MSEANSETLVTGYVPQLAATVSGVATFTCVAVALWACFWRSSRPLPKYMLCLCIATTCMCIGFGIRIAMTNNPYDVIIYAQQYNFILLPPCGFLANNYILLPRLATWLGREDCLFLRSRFIVRLFIWSDVTTLVLQATGGFLSVMQTEPMTTIGHWVALIGLVIALISFSAFMCLLVVFGLRVRARHAALWHRSQTLAWGTAPPKTVVRSWLGDWRAVYYALIWSGCGILVRCVFRVIEFSQGYDGVLRTVEVYFYVFDVLPLLLAITVWTAVWPPSVLQADRSPASEVVGTELDLGVHECRIKDEDGQHENVRTTGAGSHNAV